MMATPIQWASIPGGSRNDGKVSRLLHFDAEIENGARWKSLLRETAGISYQEAQLMIVSTQRIPC